MDLYMRAVCDIAPCSLGIYRRFRGVYCLHHEGDYHPDDEVCTSETSVYSETTWRYIREGSHLHSRRYENLKPHIIIIIIWLYSPIRARPPPPPVVVP
jgi:hypothetical protein